MSVEVTIGFSAIYFISIPPPLASASKLIARKRIYIVTKLPVVKKQERSEPSWLRSELLSNPRLDALHHLLFT